MLLLLICIRVAEYIFCGFCGGCRLYLIVACKLKRAGDRREFLFPNAFL